MEGWARLERGKGERKGGKKDGVGAESRSEKHSEAQREWRRCTRRNRVCLLLSASPTSCSYLVQTSEPQAARSL